jgi:signal transduction histidine kinase
MKASFQNIFLCSILLLCSFAAHTQNNYVDSLKKVLQTQKEDTSKVYTLINLSFYFQGISVDISLAYAQHTLDLAEKLHFEPGIFYAEINLAGALLTLGNYPLSLNYGFKALSLAQKMNDPKALAFANGNLAQCYYYLGEYSTDLRYEREVLRIAEQLYKDQIYYVWIEMSRAFEGMNQPDSSIGYAQKAFTMIMRNPAPKAVSIVCPILGNAFARRANYDSALFYYNMGIPVSIEYNLGTDLVDDYNGIAGVYKAKGNLDSAAWYSKRTLTEKIGKSYPVGALKATTLLADIYETQSKPDSTLKYLRIAIGLKDSLFNREKTIAIQNLAYKEQEKQKEIEAAKIKLKNQLIMYVLLTGLIALLVIAGILIANKRRKQLQNMRNSIADDLHDDIGSTLTNISILSELSRQHLDSKENANKFLTRISEEVNTTSQALDDIIWSVNVRNDSVDEILLRMRRYAGELFDVGKVRYELRHNDGLSGIKLSMDQRRDLYLIFKEAVNNIYKHANASGVTIELNKEEHQLVMRIKDDGKGFETKPSHRNGFKNMQSRAQKWKGDLEIESELWKGTSVVLSFPLK